MAKPPAPGLINAGGYDQVMVAQQHYILDSIKRLEEANKAVYNMVNEAKKREREREFYFLHQVIQCTIIHRIQILNMLVHVLLFLPSIYVQLSLH